MAKDVDATVLFRSRTQIIILGALYEDPSWEWLAAELCQAFGLEQSTASREIARLTSAGLIHSWLVYGHRNLKAAETNPIFSELRVLVGHAFRATV
jgi:DNA-binding transcriptional ArsR family regulator